MGHAEKSAHYRELKAAGVTLDRRYQDYTTEELSDAVTLLRQTPGYLPPVEPETIKVREQPAPVNAVAGEHAYTGLGEETPIRRDENGLLWFREEVKKPAFPAARKRRVLTYLEPGVTTKTVKNGEYIESFEVAGTGTRTAEVKITMPSFQVGIYKDPRFPFKIHTYNEMKGFDLFDVQKFYGGGDLVPSSIKRTYIANDLCYDIRSTIRAINEEYRDQQLKGNRS